jgi:hypothetical protein
LHIDYYGWISNSETDNKTVMKNYEISCIIIIVPGGPWKNFEEERR